jgi:hypothetical protein
MESAITDPTTTSDDRVRAHTASRLQSRLDEQTRERVAHLTERGSDAIDGRLKELDDESDIERYLVVNASVLAFAGVALGALVDRRWLVFPAVVTAFLFQHGVQGWCPPIPLFRRLGARTRQEIEAERFALLARLDA